MSALPATEADRDLDPVSIGQELACAAHLRVYIVIVCFRPQANLFEHDPLLALARLSFPFGLLVPILAIVKQAADWGYGLRRHFYQVQIPFAGQTQGVLDRQDTQLFAFLVNDADLTDSNGLVDAEFFSNLYTSPS